MHYIPLFLTLSEGHCNFRIPIQLEESPKKTSVLLGYLQQLYSHHGRIEPHGNINIARDANPEYWWHNPNMQLIASSGTKANLLGMFENLNFDLNKTFEFGFIF